MSCDLCRHSDTISAGNLALPCALINFAGGTAKQQTFALPCNVLMDGINWSSAFWHRRRPHNAPSIQDGEEENGVIPPSRMRECSTCPLGIAFAEIVVSGEEALRVSSCVSSTTDEKMKLLCHLPIHRPKPAGNNEPSTKNGITHKKQQELTEHCFHPNFGFDESLPS